MKIVVFTGAGISAESGIQTFRGNNGLWEGYDIYEVATPEAWKKNPELVQKFYNMRRKAVLEATPNPAHQLLANLEKEYNLHIITQNVDDLHERAGSKKVLHLHGEITKARSSIDDSLIYDIKGWELKLTDTCSLGSRLRPHIVWFGEQVPMLNEAAKLANEADIFVVIGSSLQVYPAAGLVHEIKSTCQLVVIDPEIPTLRSRNRTKFIQNKATEGLPIFIEWLKNNLV